MTFVRRTVLAAALAFSGCTAVNAAGKPLTPREEAQVLLGRGDGARALPLLKELQKKTPDDLNLARMIAEAHVKAGSVEAFLSELEKQDTALSFYQRGLVQFSRAADATGPAIASFRRATDLAPQEPEFRYRLGVALLESEQFEAARTALESAVAQAPEHAGWFLPVAKARYRTNDEHGAIEAIRAVVMGNTTPSEVKTARALMDQIVDPFAGFPRSARPQLEQAIQWLEVADVPQQAIVQLEELLRDLPDEAVLHALLGLAWARLDDAGRAVEELKRAIELAPTDGKNHLYLAALYDARQRTKNAEEQYEKALERNPVLGEAWLKLGDLALDRQNLVAARKNYEIASRLDPDDIGARGKLALVHQLDGNWPAAERELHAVLDKDPENLEFMLRLGVLHLEHFTRARSPTDREAAAKEASIWLEKVLEAQPENAVASRALARLKQR